MPTAAGPKPMPNVWIDPIAQTTRPSQSASQQIPDSSGCAKFHDISSSTIAMAKAVDDTLPTSSK